MTSPPIKRLDILNALAARFDHQSYLEIGVAGGATFRNVQVPSKVGVDPAWRWWYALRRDIVRKGSDAFFEKNRRSFDLILVDGLHVAENAFADIINSLQCLSDNGSILVHDCLPTSHAEQAVPRQQATWTGNVWRAFAKAAQLPEVEAVLFNANRGCGLLRPSAGMHHSRPPLHIDPMSDAVEWEEYDANKHEWLHIVPHDQILSFIAGLPAVGQGCPDDRQVGAIV